MSRSTGFAAFGQSSRNVLLFRCALASDPSQHGSIGQENQHHRRTSSLIRKNVSPSSSYKAGLTHEQATARMKPFKFPSTPLMSAASSSDSDTSSNASDDNDSSPNTSLEAQHNNSASKSPAHGLLATTASSSKGGLGAIRETDSSDSSPDQSPLASRQLRYQQHRFSPSNPYGVCMPSNSHHDFQNDITRLSYIKLLATRLRRAKLLDLSFGAVFTLSVLVFLAALSGVGYQAPNKTTLPLSVGISHPVAAAAVAQQQQQRPAAQAIPARSQPVRQQPLPPVVSEEARAVNTAPIAPVADQPASEVPLKIREEDEDESAGDAEDTPFWQADQVVPDANKVRWEDAPHVNGGRPVARTGDGRREAPVQNSQADSLARQIAVLKQQQMQELDELEQRMREEDGADAAEVEIVDAPAEDEDEHATMENVFDKDFVPSDPDNTHMEHEHSFRAMQEAELIDEAEEEEDNDLHLRDLTASEMED